MRLVFAGTPATAVPSLDALLKSGHEVAAVVTRPDAPAGRGLRLAPSPVAQRAEAAGLEVLKPAKPGDPEFLDHLRRLAPDCCPVTAYGALLPQRALDVPFRGWVNLHFSLLPAWRGAAPVQHAILHGDEVTGATTFRIVAALDAGPVFGVVTEAIRPDDTAGDLLDRLAVSGAELLVATIDGIESGQLVAREQPADGVSLAPKITAEDARVRWGDPAVAVDRAVRACTPAPGAWTELDGTRVKLWPFAGIGTGDGDPDLAPGQLRVKGPIALVGTGTQPVALGDVQAHGKRRMPAADWLRGLRLGTSGAVLG
ncbi:MAG TPA: methionyl-tRNA formyltransferase [Streptosporangiaceae bacterium]|nr:methionyl-tRNA formyltransferase [Streptosporangiaceae bacterium]